MTELSVLIPAYNESARIAATLHTLQDSDRVEEILVVDDGSSDQTAGLARAAGAKVLQLPHNIGKGGAVTAAVPFIKGNIVLILDADLQDCAAKALCLAEPVLAGSADLTIARFQAKKSGHGLGMARRTAAWGIKLMTGTTVRAPLSGQRCLKKNVLFELLPLSPRFGLEVGMTLDALRRGYRVLEIEVDLTHCPPGRNLQGFFHRGRQFFDICLALGSRAGRTMR